MDFEPDFKVHNLVSVHPKNIILGQMIQLNMIFHMVESFIDMFKFETRPSFLLNFGRADSAVLKLKFPCQSRISAVPDLHAGVFTVILVAFQRRELFCLQRVEIVNLWRILRVRFRSQG